MNTAKYLKNRPLKFIILSFSLIAASSGCIRQEGASSNQPTENDLKEQLIEANKNMVEVESEQITAYISRRGWDMKSSGTGLRYMVYKAGQGPNAKEGQVALVDYEVSLLNGENLYSSKNSGPQEFLIGMDDVESGLHEGITFMNVGSKAKLILPIHLAHGLLGDENKIPSNATIVYDIELLALK